MKKVFGYIFYTLSVLFALAIIFRLIDLIKDVMIFLHVMTEDVPPYAVGKAIGRLLGWIINFGLVIFFWIFGEKWTRISSEKQPK